MRDMTGHTGAVNALAVAGEHLFSGGQDATIRAWKYDAAAQTFALLGVMQGHSAPVQTLAAVAGRLFSGALDGAVGVWDAANGTQLQMLAGHQQAVTKVLNWMDHAISCDMGGVICVWGRQEDAAGNPVPDSPFAGKFQFPEGGAGAAGNSAAYVTMCGTADGEGKPVLLCANPLEGAVRILELPNFVDRGVITERQEVKALAAAGELMFAGVVNGSVKIFKWRQPRSQR
jgi:hypothetical protein